MHSSVGMQLISVIAMLQFFAGSRRCVANNSTSCTENRHFVFPIEHRIELIYKGSWQNSYSIVEKKKQIEAHSARNEGSLFFFFFLVVFEQVQAIKCLVLQNALQLFEFSSKLHLGKHCGHTECYPKALS